MQGISDNKQKWTQICILLIIGFLFALLINMGFLQVALFSFIFLIFIVLCCIYPDYIFLFWIFLFPLFDNFFSISLGKYPDITFTRIVIITLFILELIKSIQRDEKIYNKPQKQIIFLCVIYSLWVLISSLRPDLIDPKFSLRVAIDAWIIPTLVIIIGIKYLSKKKVSDIFFKIVPFVGLYCAIIAAVEFITRIDIFSLGEEYGIKGTAYFARANGPFTSDATLSSFLLFIIAFTFVSVIQSRRNLLKILYSILIIIMTIGIFFTLVRQNILISLIMMLMFFLLFGPKKKIVALPVIVIVSIIFFPFIRDDIISSPIYKNRILDVGTIESRISGYRTGINLVKNNFLFGVGYGNYHRVSSEYELRFQGIETLSSPHNGILGVAGELGVIGLFIFFLMYYYVFHYIYINRHSFFGKLFLIIFVSYLLMNMTISVVNHPVICMINMIFISLVFSEIKSKKGIFFSRLVNE